jgi:hypothetical protein
MGIRVKQGTPKRKFAEFVRYHAGFPGIITETGAWQALFARFVILLCPGISTQDHFVDQE